MTSVVMMSMSVLLTMAVVVTVVKILLGHFIALVKLDTSLGLMARLVTIIMNAQRAVMVAIIIAITLLVLITAHAIQATRCLQTVRLVLTLMSARLTLTTVLRYVETQLDPSRVVVTQAMCCRTVDTVTTLTSALLVTAGVLTLVLTMPVHLYAAVTLVTTLPQTENHVSIPTNVLPIMEGVDTTAQIRWGLTVVLAVAGTICLRTYMDAATLVSAAQTHMVVTIIAGIVLIGTHATAARDICLPLTVQHAKISTSVIKCRTYAVSNAPIVWEVTHVDVVLAIS